VIAGGETLYVLDNSGHDLKVLTTEGKQLANFGIDKITECSSFSASDDFYVFNNIPRENVPSNVGLFLLVSGRPQSRKRMGATINTKEGLAFSVFNRAFLSANESSIFGAFKSYPAVFRYDSEGREIFFKNIKENDEIKKLEKWGKRKNVDIPEKVRGNKNVTALIYCDGFGVNGRCESFCALNVNHGSDGVILVFDGAGKAIRKIVPQYEKRRVRIERILVQDESLYTLVSAKDRKGIYLVNINLKEVR
jgi:hypothetical protein